jgi:beta-1,4-mannosyltransferase
MHCMQQGSTATGELVVGSWPGEEFRDNPYIARFCESLRSAGIRVESVAQPWDALNTKLDILHIHWPEQVLWGHGKAAGLARASAVLAALALLRARGVRLVWCVHNLEPHDPGRARKLAWRYYAASIAQLVHGYVTLSPSTLALARARFAALARKPASSIWHAPYRIGSVPADAQLRARQGVLEGETLLVFVGAIRRYKGVVELVRCFAGMASPTLRLLVAGELGDPALGDTLTQLAARDPRLHLAFGRLSDQELLATVCGADAVVLPFERTLHSGSLIYALSCGKPVITPRTAYASDLAALLGSEWVRTYEPPLTPELLARLCHPAAGAPDLTPLSTTASGAKIRDFYRSLLPARGQRS